MTAIGSEPTALYRWYGIDGRLLYVGISCDPVARTRAHSQQSAWWPNAATSRVEWFASRAEAIGAECAAIGAEHPEYNVIRTGSLSPEAEAARTALVEATRVREAGARLREEGWRQAILDALTAGVGATEIARLAGVTRGRVYQIRDEAREGAQR